MIFKDFLAPPRSLLTPRASVSHSLLNSPPPYLIIKMYKLYTVTSLLLAMATTVTCSPIAGTDLSGDVTLLDKRQGSSGCPMITVVSTTDHSPGNGDPHQNYYHRQISNTVTCGSGDCSVTSESAPVSRFTNSATFEYWISGGFAVEQSLPGGDTFTCSASAGDTVCVWQNVAYTAVSHPPLSLSGTSDVSLIDFNSTPWARSAMIRYRVSRF